MKRFIVMGIVLLITSAAYVGCRSHKKTDMAKRMEQRADWIAEKIEAELELTADQKNILNSIKKEVIAKQSDMTILRDGVVTDALSVLDKESVTEAELNTLLAERETTMKEFRQFAVSKYVQFHNSLTKEQKIKLKEKIEKIKGYRG